MKKIRLVACERVELLWKEGGHLLAATLAKPNLAFQRFAQQTVARRVRADLTPLIDHFFDPLIDASTL